MDELKITALFGGTFDPIHYGHIHTITALAKDFNFTKVYLMPNNRPPHKPVPQATPKQRLDMLKLAIKGLPLFDIEGYELRRNGTSYTIDTLKAWRKSHNEHQSLVFIIGEDSLVQLTRWKNWEEILNYCHLIVCPRSGVSTEKYEPRLKEWIKKHSASDKALLRTEAHGYLFFSKIPLSNISATMVRHYISNNKSTEKILPSLVYHYIKNNNIY